MIAIYLTTMSDHTDCCTKQYHWVSAIYLLSYLALEFSVIIDRAVGAPGHGKYLVDGLNTRDKRMLKSEMANLLTHKLI